MKTNPRFRTIALSCLAAGVIAAGQAHAGVTYSYDVSNPVDVPGIATFATTGAMMSGLSVTAYFGTSSETLSWATTGPGSGGVSGTGWSLGLAGDSYYNNWNFSFGQGVSALTKLVLDGAPGLTVFDLYLDGDTGTLNSAAGKDFTFSLANQYDVTATYSKPVGVAGAPPYDDGAGSGPDLWQVLTFDFGTAGIQQDFSFVQDTDNRIPEPASLALLGVGLLGLGFSRRRKS